MCAFMRLVSIVAAIGGALYGYDTGIIAGALLSIAEDQWREHMALLQQRSDGDERINAFTD